MAHEIQGYRFVGPGRGPNGPESGGRTVTGVSSGPQHEAARATQLERLKAFDPLDPEARKPLEDGREGNPSLEAGEVRAEAEMDA